MFGTSQRDWTYRAAYEKREERLDASRERSAKHRRYLRRHGHLRDECSKVHQFTSIADAQTKIKAWGINDNARQPHSSLGHLTPKEFVAQRQEMRIIEASTCRRTYTICSSLDLDFFMVTRSSVETPRSRHLPLIRSPIVSWGTSDIETHESRNGDPRLLKRFS
jgi:hypothetical protein